MITFLKGTLTDALPTQAVIDVNGIGYEVLIPLSSFEKLPELGQAVTLPCEILRRPFFFLFAAGRLPKCRKGKLKRGI